MHSPLYGLASIFHVLYERQGAFVTFLEGHDEGLAFGAQGTSSASDLAALRPIDDRVPEDALSWALKQPERKKVLTFMARVFL